MANFDAIQSTPIYHNFTAVTNPLPSGTEVGVYQPFYGFIYKMLVPASYPRNNTTFAVSEERNVSKANSFVDDYYYRMHLNPSILNLGNIIRETQVIVEVFNAYFENVNLVNIVPEGVLGILGQLGSGLGDPLPETIKSLRSTFFYITISLNGPGTIDASYTFDFSKGMDLVLKILGSRLIAFAIPPNWDDRVSEKLVFWTDILEARDGTEQRIIMRHKPRWTISYSLLEGPGKVNLLDSYYVAWANKKFIIPLWWLKTSISAAVMAGATVIPCSTQGRGLKVGDTVLIWKDALHCETVILEGVTNNYVTISSQLSLDYSGGYVIPSKIGSFSEPENSIDTVTSNIIESKVSFDVDYTDDWESTDFTDKINGKSISPYIHDYSSPRPRQIAWKMVKNDNEIGQIYKTFLEDEPRDIIEIEDALLGTHEEAEQFKKWVMFNYGMAKSFYVLLDEDHFIVTRDIKAETALLYLQDSSYWAMESKLNVRTFLFLKTYSGERYFFRPGSYSNLSSTEVAVDVDITWPKDIPLSNIRQIGFVLLVRFNQDEFEIIRQQDLYSRISFSLKGVKS
jgi:hypothetical protein